MNDTSQNFEEPLVFQQGQVIFAEGESAGFLYLVSEGEVRIVKEVNNRLLPISIIREKGFIGELSIFSDDKRNATAIATKDTKLVMIKKSDIRKVIGKCPEWVSEIMTTLSDRLRHSVEILREHQISDDSNESEKLLPSDIQNYLRNIKDYKVRRGLS